MPSARLDVAINARSVFIPYLLLLRPPRQFGRQHQGSMARLSARLRLDEEDFMKEMELKVSMQPLSTTHKAFRLNSIPSIRHGRAVPGMAGTSPAMTVKFNDLIGAGDQRDDPIH